MKPLLNNWEMLPHVEGPLMLSLYICVDNGVLYPGIKTPFILWMEELPDYLLEQLQERPNEENGPDWVHSVINAHTLSTETPGCLEASVNDVEEVLAKATYTATLCQMERDGIITLEIKDDEVLIKKTELFDAAVEAEYPEIAFLVNTKRRLRDTLEAEGE